MRDAPFLEPGMNITKNLPPQPNHTLDRERLLDRLISWEDKKLVIIHGQAGQGKSTLAARYAGELSTPFVWYNMDREDDDPIAFLSCLGQAVQRAWPERIPRLPPVPQNVATETGMRQGIPRWIGQVFGNINSSGLIIFDDVHAASSPAIHGEIFKMLLDSTPPPIRFMLISRTRPELEIAKLRAKKAVGELTGNDLKFNDAETHDLFCAIFGMRVAPHEAALINRTAEGWPAGLVLMHEYLAADPSADGIAALSGRTSSDFQSQVFDYLAQEVFSHLSPEMQEFLLRTSITEELPSPLIERLTGLPQNAKLGKTSVASVIEELRRKNLFVSTTNDTAPVVRYHALFRDFLVKKLAHRTPASGVAKLYTIAAQYYRETGDQVREVNLYLASSQFTKAAALIEAIGRELIARGRTQTLLRWIADLPTQERDRPWFLFYRAVAARFTDPASALVLLERALAGFRKEQRQSGDIGQMLALCGIIEVCFHAGGDFRRMARAAAQAKTLLDRNKGLSSEMKARLLLSMGIAWFFIGRLQEGADALSQALDLFRKHGDPFYLVTSAIYLAPCALYQGDFKLAREALRLGFEADAAIQDEAGGRAALFLTKAMTALFEGNFAEAQECIDQCRNLSDVHALESIGFLSLDISGWLKIAQGDYAGAEVLLKESKRKGEESRNAFFSGLAAHFLAIVRLFQNKPDKAKKESDFALSIRPQSDSRLFHGIYLIASGAIHLKLGEPARAEKDLLTALKMLQQIKAAQQEANAHLMLARLYEAKKKTDASLKHLQKGFAIGQERGFTYYALFTAAELATLARKGLAHDICPEYCESLLSDLSRAREAPRLRIHCFGGFRVKRGETVVRDSEWKSKRAKVLVKLLISHDGHKVARDAAMEMLWPDASTDSLSMTLNSMLYRARKVLDAGAKSEESSSCIVQEGDLLSLNSGAVWTDVGQFLLHNETAVRMKAKKDLKKTVAEYEKAFSLYQGDFLPEDLYHDWAGAMRDRLRLLYLKALQDAGNIAESLGDKEKASSFQERAFSSDPCNETACRWLMTRYLSNGQRGEAVRTYERCERALSMELDLEPDERTKKLFRSVIER